jgi:hypothetical protein
MGGQLVEIEIRTMKVTDIRLVSRRMQADNPLPHSL